MNCDYTHKSPHYMSKGDGRKRQRQMVVNSSTWLRKPVAHFQSTLTDPALTQEGMIGVAVHLEGWGYCSPTVLGVTKGKTNIRLSVLVRDLGSFATWKSYMTVSIRGRCCLLDREMSYNGWMDGWTESEQAGNCFQSYILVKLLVISQAWKVVTFRAESWHSSCHIWSWSLWPQTASAFPNHITLALSQHRTFGQWQWTKSTCWYSLPGTVSLPKPQNAQSSSWSKTYQTKPRYLYRGDESVPHPVSHKHLGLLRAHKRTSPPKSGSMVARLVWVFT